MLRWPELKESVKSSVLALFGQTAVQLDDEWVARDFLNKMIQIKVDPQPGANKKRRNDS
jgi:hypothetical protein